MNTVSKPYRKKDAMQLVTGQPVYMDDLVPGRLPHREAPPLSPRQRDREEHQHRCGEEGAGH